MRLRHAVLGLLGLVVGSWIAAHVVLFVFVVGLVVGFLAGSLHGRRRATLRAAREIVAEHARALGRSVVEQPDRRWTDGPLRHL